MDDHAEHAQGLIFHIPVHMQQGRKHLQAEPAGPTLSQPLLEAASSTTLGLV